MSKIVIIAGADADDDVKDAVKLLKAAGHDVDTEEPTPKALLHIVLGLMGPNSYGFGPGYGYTPAPSSDTPTDADTPDDPASEDPPVDDTSSEGDTSSEDADISNDDFNFESLGVVNIDGELIEAKTHDSETSVLCVEGIVSGPKTTYALNESIFSFWPANQDKPTQRVEVSVNEHHASVELPVEKAEGKATLLVGRDLLNMFKK